MSLLVTRSESVLLEEFQRIVTQRITLASFEARKEIQICVADELVEASLRFFAEGVTVGSDETDTITSVPAGWFSHILSDFAVWLKKIPLATSLRTWLESKVSKTNIVTKRVTKRILMFPKPVDSTPGRRFLHYTLGEKTTSYELIEAAAYLAGMPRCNICESIQRARKEGWGQ